MSSGVSRPTMMVIVLSRHPYLADALRKNVLCGIDVSVVDGSASRAYPIPNAEAFYSGIFCSAAVTSLRGREESINNDDFFPVPQRLVGELPADFTPRDTHDAFCQLMVLDHVLHREILYADDIVFSNEPRRHLVEGILPLVGNFLMESSNTHPCLLAVLAPL